MKWQSMEWKEKCFRILKILLLDITILYCFFSFTGNVQAATHSEQEKDVDQQLQETMDGYLEELDFSDIDTMLEQQDGTEGLNFKGLVEKLVNGEEIDKGWLLDELLSAVFSEVAEFRGTLVQMVLLCIVFAILYNFANVFENPSVTEISFYMVYMLLLVLLMRSFFILRDISITVISHMMDFLKVMIPTFTASMAFSGQITTAAGFYDLTFILIYALEWLMKYLIIPAVQIYVALELINHLTEEDMISRMTALVKSGILWCMKCLYHCCGNQCCAKSLDTCD